MKRWKWITICVVVFGCPVFCCAASKFQFTDLGTLGGNSSEGYGINNLGVVVGGSNLTGEPDYTGFRHAFLNDGSAHNLGTLGGSFSVGRGINDQGVVVGESSLASGGQHAFLYDGTMHDLGSIGFGTPSTALAINNSGQVVGYISDSKLRPFLYDGTMHLLDPSASYSGQAVAINNLGDVLINSDFGPHLYRPGSGTSYYGNVMDTLGEWQVINVSGMNDAGVIVGGGRHGSTFANAYLFDGAMHDVGRLSGSVSSILYDVNNRGDAVGVAVSYGQGPFGVTIIYTPLFYSPETGLVDLNTLVPGFALAQAVAINDAGQITGYTFNEHAYLLTPLVPEPGSVAILATGLLGLCCRRSPRRVL